MYAAIVERVIRNGFRQLNRGDIDAVLALFADDAVLQFPGEHALAADCRGKPEIARWFRNLRRLLPTLQFEIVDVTVRGWPWNTRVLTRFVDRVEFANTPTITNRGVQYLRLSWGKVREDVLYLDTQTVARACRAAGS
jgi:ketosteroid isomerase-like protein